MAQIPEKLVNYRVYGGNGGIELLGTTDVELPNFDFVTEKITGAGIAGEYDSPVIGHLQSTVLKLKWRVFTAAGIGLLAQVQHALQLRPSVQVTDPAAGILATEAWLIEARGQVKTFKLGKLEPGKPTDAESEIEIAAMQISRAGVALVAIDKFNYRFIVNGTDYLAKVRADMGGN